MVVRSDLLERDDTEVRKRSLRDGKNLRALASGGIEARWGSFVMAQYVGARQLVEIKPADGETYLLVLRESSLLLLNEDGSSRQSISPVPWTDASTLWVETFRNRTIIGGGIRPHVLLYNGATFTLNPFDFALGPGGEVAQPYWSFRPGSRLSVGGYTGTVSLVYFAPGSVNPDALPAEITPGTRIRYHNREIVVTSSNSGTVTTRLPPSFEVTVSNPNSFLVDQVVIGNDTGWQGYICGISGNDLLCATLSGFSGPDNGESISGPNGSSTITGVALESGGYASPIWDEPLFSDYKGWPRSAASAAGRLAFVDHPSAPDVIAVSSARSIDDFAVGQEDDDAIVRAIGDNSPRLLHAVSVGDLIILSDRGCYNIPTRENGVLTPSTFNPVQFDRRGASGIRPAQVDDGVAFIDASGTKLLAALLDGNVYLKWSIRDLSILAPDLIRSPTMLCQPVIDDAAPEKYILIVNADGTMTAASWQDALGPETVGFCLWETAGAYRAAAPAFGSYWTLVAREGEGRTIERFSPDAYLDGARVASALPLNLSHLTEVSVYANGNSFGPVSVADLPPLTNGWQVGANFVSSALMWPEEVIDSGRNGMFEAKVIRFGVSVQDTRSLQIRTNRTTRTMGAYSFGDDLSVPPPLQTRRYRVPVFGTRTHPDLEVIKHEPGPWRILAAIQEAQA
jgi:hypothetical protein